MHTKTKTFVELNKRGTVDLRENWTVDNNGFVWDENGNPVHVKGEKNLGQVTEMELVNPEDPEDRRTVYTSSGKSVSQAAESYLEHSHDTSVWSEELIELKIKIQPVVLKRLIEDDMMMTTAHLQKIMTVVNLCGEMVNSQSNNGGFGIGLWKQSSLEKKKYSLPTMTPQHLARQMLIGFLRMNP